MTQEIERKERAVIAKAENAEMTEATNLFAAILRIAGDKSVDVDKVEKLLQMHERLVERNAKVAFESALSRVQAKLPTIQQTGVIMNKQGTAVRSRYARLEDIDSIVRPLLSEEGLSLSFDTEEMPSGKIRLIAKLAHKDGHSESKGIPLPIDKNEYRTAIQDHGSTISFGRRYLLKMHLNIIEKYEDNDGQGNDDLINKEQLLDLNTLIVDSKPDMEVFLEYMGVSKIEDITQKHYGKAMTTLGYRKAHAGRNKK